MSLCCYKLSWFELLLTFLGGCLLLFVVAPLFSMFLATSFPEIREAFADTTLTDSIGRTVFIALVATILCAFLGVPLAYLLARKKFVGRSFLLAVMELPIVIPHSAAGIALLSVFGRESVSGQIAEKWGLSFIGSPLGIGCAMAFVSVPYLISGAREAFISVPTRLEKVARTLGASPARVFFTISLPMAWRGILSGLVLMWARGMSEFGAVIIIAYHPMTAPVLVFQRFNDYGLSYARAGAVLLILVSVLIFSLLRFLSQKRDDLEGEM
ncbi:MAG: ABC transporter permease [Alphaproteobacteria bacterium]